MSKTSRFRSDVTQSNEQKEYLSFKGFQRTLCLETVANERVVLVAVLGEPPVGIKELAVLRGELHKL